MKATVVYAHTIEARDRANAMLLAGATPAEVAAELGDAVRISEVEAKPEDNWPTLVYDGRDAKAARERRRAEEGE